MNTLIYDDFYVAFLDMAGNVIYPTDPQDSIIIRKLLKNKLSNGLAYTEDEKKCYRIKYKRKQFDGKSVQIVCLVDVTDYIKKITNASIDEITHLNNRKIARTYFIDYIEKAFINNEDFTIILGDLDEFKTVNDTYGHATGDILLSETSRIMYCSTRQEHYRQQDIVARIGGDEFFILLKNINEETSLARAEKIRKTIEDNEIALYGENNATLKANIGTMSMGLYHVKCEELRELYDKGYTTDEIKKKLLDRCDTALYESKNNGKNRVTVFEKQRNLHL